MELILGYALNCPVLTLSPSLYCFSYSISRTIALLLAFSVSITFLFCPPHLPYHFLALSPALSLSFQPYRSIAFFLYLMPCHLIALSPYRFLAPITFLLLSLSHSYRFPAPIAFPLLSLSCLYPSCSLSLLLYPSSNIRPVLNVHEIDA
jgi:hypothetical protein